MVNLTGNIWENDQKRIVKYLQKMLKYFKYRPLKLKIYKKIERERTLTTRELYYYGRELFDNKKYIEAIRILKKFY